MNVSFSPELSAQEQKRPVCRRLASTMESPARYVRKGCRCDMTDSGFTILADATTHTDCPGMCVESYKAELKSPHRFYRFIMRKDVLIGNIDRQILKDFMLQGFESPFDSIFDAKLHKNQTVKVQLVQGSVKARDELVRSSSSKGLWSRFKLAVHAQQAGPPTLRPIRSGTAR